MITSSTEGPALVTITMFKALQQVNSLVHYCTLSEQFDK